MELFDVHDSMYLYRVFSMPDIELEIYINRICNNGLFVELGARNKYLTEFSNKTQDPEFLYSLHKDDFMSEQYHLGFSIYSNQVSGKQRVYPSDIVVEDIPDICRALQRAIFWKNVLSQWVKEIDNERN